MQKIRKYTILGILCIILIIPILFGIYTEYLLISELNLIILFIFLLGLVLFLLIDKLIAVYGYDIQSFEAMKKQDVINAFIGKNNKAIIWIFLPIIMIIEELIFRYYLIGFLLNVIIVPLTTILMIFALLAVSTGLLLTKIPKIFLKSSPDLQQRKIYISTRQERASETVKLFYLNNYLLQTQNWEKPNKLN